MAKRAIKNTIISKKQCQLPLGQQPPAKYTQATTGRCGAKKKYIGKAILTLALLFGDKGRLMRRNKTWTQEEKDFLVENWGTTVSKKYLAGKMKRSVEGISKMARKLNLGPYALATDDMTYAELARALGVYTSYAWYKKRLLEAGLPVYNKRVNNGTVLKVKFKKFWTWAGKNKDVINWAKVEPNILGVEPAWVDEQRKKDIANRPNYTKKWTATEHQNLIHYINSGFSMEQIAKKLNRTASAIERRCYDYYLPRPRLEAKRSWSDTEIEQIFALRNQGLSFKNIAAKVGRSERSIRGKIRDVERKKRKAV